MDSNTAKQKKAYNEHFDEYDIAVSRTYELYKPHTIDKWKKSFVNK